MDQSLLLASDLYNHLYNKHMNPATIEAPRGDSMSPKSWASGLVTESVL